MSRAEDGRIAYRMKRALPHGTTHLFFTGMEKELEDGVGASASAGVSLAEGAAAGGARSLQAVAATRMKAHQGSQSG